MILAAFLAYLCLHFVGYAVVFRHRRTFAAEKAVFGYHFVPALAWGVGIATLGCLGLAGPAHLVLVAALHGIYSLTFLELWALADGGYSLAIMDCLEFRRGADEKTTLDRLAVLGTAKKQQRVGDLIRMHLVEVVDDRYRLSASGRLLAAAIAFLVRLANVSLSH